MARPGPLDIATCNYDRWLSLWKWCESIGCCYVCAIMASCAIVQREANNREWGKPPTEKCTNKRIAPEYCLDLVRTNWKDAPTK